MVDLKRRDFKSKKEWRREQERKEFEKYNIGDGALIMMMGSAVSCVVFLTHALKAFTRPEPFPNILPYILGILVLIVINAFGIMLTKKKRKFNLGSLIEIGTILATIGWTYYNVTHII